MVGRKLLEDRSGTEVRAAETERKLSELMSQINNLMRTDVTEVPACYSVEQTLNTVRLFIFFLITCIYLPCETETFAQQRSLCRN